MDIMGKMKAKEEERQKTAAELKEAEEAKAAEYAALQARIDELETTVTSLQTTIESLNQTLQTITPQDIDEFKEKSLTLFDPLRKTAEAVNTKIKAAGYEAAQTLKNAGEKSWTEYGIESLLTSCIYIALTSAVLWFMLGIGDIKKDVEYNRDRIDAIQWNQTTGTTDGARKYSPWEMQDFHKAWDNQQTYIINKQREEEAEKNQK